MIFIKYLPPVKPKLVPKLKVLGIYLNLAHLNSKYVDLDFNVKNNFYEIFPNSYVQIGPKINYAQNLLKFGPFDISNMPISILISKIIFIKYLPPN